MSKNLFANPYRTEAERWRAWQERDPLAIGAFFVAVKSTRIYCRVGCPARSPKRENVHFFDTPQAAEAAGYRACLRCKPRETPGHIAVVYKVKSLLEQAEKSPTLQELGKAVGLSPFHLQRLFKQETGLSPKQYATAWRLGKFKEQVRMKDSVTEAIYEAGYGSSSNLYRQSNARLGMSPRVYRRGGKGMRIRYAFADSLVGKLVIGVTEKGICSLLIGDSEAELEALLREEFAEAELERGILAEYVQPVLDYLTQQTPLKTPLDLRGTAFQLKVWQALRQIPAGQTRTYGELARMVGDPKAVRAAAGACGANPVSLVVPCHRVVGRDGKPTGYRWGVERKKKLLEHEKPQPILL
ncbi:bifunctional DNA-binding transcriptional regulator/O6-methylguanine-DNA methyltransferase Ada [uncultured Meiothermus sp.]|jgi:AraC family transcriptional regulator of adaptative response/methylated-DNA-[protein]-cysteine methyltransferase|uniref:bifunctional DNA-binding transcriptional regulator/O6-methylguanine-DNA methyltransferase Ada n=1 Tax=uncultured Meiothermus sp. TaxID=157471 RepID=UPI00262E8EE5|nr:bifunctional DNA-binding transcriptional regulator/O6-methylguanine-DNA methyltransferase Ada [uncultured Meiothermus sp.]